MSKTIIAVRHFGLGGRESLETAVTTITFFEKIRNRFSLSGKMANIAQPFKMFQVYFVMFLFPRRY